MNIAYRAFQAPESTKPDDVKAVEIHLAIEEEEDKRNGFTLEQFLEKANQKFKLNELTAVQLLEVASQNPWPISMKRSEQFLLRHSRRSLEEKMELAQKFNLDRLKQDCYWKAGHFNVEPMEIDAQQMDWNHLQQLQMANFIRRNQLIPEQQEAAVQIKERSRDVFIETGDDHRIYLGRLGDPECEANLSRYLEVARNTDSVPRYFSPIVLQSSEPGFVPPIIPIKAEMKEEFTLDYCI